MCFIEHICIYVQPIGLRSYALAVSKTMDKTLVEGMSTIIMELIENGEIDVIENHWTKEYSECFNILRVKLIFFCH